MLEDGPGSRRPLMQGHRSRTHASSVRPGSWSGGASAAAGIAMVTGPTAIHPTGVPVPGVVVTPDGLSGALACAVDTPRIEGHADAPTMPVAFRRAAVPVIRSGIDTPAVAHEEAGLGSSARAVHALAGTARVPAPPTVVGVRLEVSAAVAAALHGRGAGDGDASRVGADRPAGASIAAWVWPPIATRGKRDRHQHRSNRRAALASRRTSSAILHGKTALKSRASNCTHSPGQALDS